MRQALVIAITLAISFPAVAQNNEIDDMARKLREHADLYQKKHKFGKSRSIGTFGDPRSAGFFAVDAEKVESSDPTVQSASEEYADLVPDLQINVMIEFDLNKSDLRVDQKPKLEKVCAAMKESGLEAFKIVGHTDEIGTDAYNDGLSLARAKQVKSHLVGQCNISSDKLQVLGLGEKFLLKDTTPTSPRNRRVEFQGMG